MNLEALMSVTGLAGGAVGGAVVCGQLYGLPGAALGLLAGGAGGFVACAMIANLIMRVR